jgi:reactive intermediate/imine deaminase
MLLRAAEWQPPGTSALPFAFINNFSCFVPLVSAKGKEKRMEEKGMKKEIIVSEKLSRPLGIYSQAVKAEGNRLLFISGMTARDKDGNILGKGDIKVQTRQVLENIKAVLEKAGATFDQIVKVTVFITDMSRFKEIHEIRAQYFKKNYPASTMVQVSGLVSPDMLIEIEAIAVLD